MVAGLDHRVGEVGAVVDHPQADLAVIEQHGRAGTQGGEHLGMRHADPRGVARRGLQVEAQRLAVLQADRAVGELPQADLRALQVGQHRQRPAHHGLGLANRGDGGGVVVVGPVAEVHPEDVGAGHRQLAHLVDATAGGAEGGDDSRSACTDHGVRLRLPEPS